MTDNKTDEAIGVFLHKKSEQTIALFDHFLNEYKKLGTIYLYPAKTMIGIEHDGRRIAWITQLGRNFIHVVFPFETAYSENLCFTKVAQVPGDKKQFNHHFRMYYKEDVNEEVIRFMKLALD